MGAFTHIIRKSDSNSDSETFHCLTDAASKMSACGKTKASKYTFTYQVPGTRYQQVGYQVPVPGTSGAADSNLAAYKEKF